MSAVPLRIQLIWDDPITGDRRSPILTVPIALGREFAQMPAQIGEQRVSRIVLASEEISRFHSLITLEPAGCMVMDQSSSNGTFVNGVLRSRSLLAHGDRLQLGPYTITVSFAVAPAAAAPPIAEPLQQTSLPLLQRSQVSLQDLYATGLPVQEADYAALGAGLGSFYWVDLLRISGVSAAQMTVLGLTPQPYAHDPLFTQLTAEERLRSPSDACPDNLWGWPSYALRESAADLRKGRLGSAGQYLWQVFAEPTFTDPYVPQVKDVIAAIDREAHRIGWQQMFCSGQVQALRQTSDGRYAIAYLCFPDTQNWAFLVARSVYIASDDLNTSLLPDTPYPTPILGTPALTWAMHPLLTDLVSHYQLPLSPLGHLSLTPNFELIELRNGRGRLFVTDGITRETEDTTSDRLLELQYVAFQTLNDLLKAKAPGLQRLHLLRSAWQWCKWVWNQAPDP